MFKQWFSFILILTRVESFRESPAHSLSPDAPLSPRSSEVPVYSQWNPFLLVQLQTMGMPLQSFRKDQPSPRHYPRPGLKTAAQKASCPPPSAQLLGQEVTGQER